MANSRKPQRQSYNSVNSQVKANMYANSVIEFPEGVFFESERDLALWRQYTSIRLACDWRDTDLLMVSKMIALEKDIDVANEVLAREGLLVDAYSKDGDIIGQKEHPMVKVRDGLLAKLVSCQRHLSINQMASDPTTVNAHGKKAAQQAKAKSTAKVSLLATL
jgi:hypothetical protein